MINSKELLHFSNRLRADAWPPNIIETMRIIDNILSLNNKSLSHWATWWPILISVFCLCY